MSCSTPPRDGDTLDVASVLSPGGQEHQWRERLFPEQTEEQMEKEANEEGQQEGEAGLEDGLASLTVTEGDANVRNF